jgi:hypothetical protein
MRTDHSGERNPLDLLSGVFPHEASKITAVRHVTVTAAAVFMNDLFILCIFTIAFILRAYPCIP